MHLVTSGVFMGVFRQRGPCPSVNYLFLYFRLLVQGGCVLLLVFAFHFAFPADARATSGCAGRRPPRRPPRAASAGEVEKSAKHLSRVGSRDASTVEGSRAVSSGATSTAPCTAAASAAAACRSNRKRERCCGWRAPGMAPGSPKNYAVAHARHARPPDEAQQRRRAYG